MANIGKSESNYNLIDWWKKVYIKNYANFKGRARRAEYWYYSLANFILIFILAVLSILLENYGESKLFSMFEIIFALFYISLIIPSLAVLARRFHDINRSGWSFFFYLIPIAGPVIVLVFLFTDGNRFINNYGEDPKNPTSTPIFDFEQNDVIKND